MCVIIYAPKGKVLTKELLEREATGNPDGWGVMMPDGEGGLAVWKGLDMDEGVKTALELPSDRERLIHFRIATNGAIVRENCHPFQVGQGIGLMHNGIIPKFSNLPDVSDTKLFASYLGPIMRKERLPVDSPRVAEIIKEVDNRSRFALMNSEGTVALFGDWVDDGDFKLSNSSCAFRTRHYSTGGYYGSGDYGYSSTSNYTRTITVPNLKLTDMRTWNTAKLTELATEDFEGVMETILKQVCEAIAEEVLTC